MNITVPIIDAINHSTLKKVQAIGLKNTGGPIPPVFSFEIPVSIFKDLKHYEISDELYAKVDQIQFKCFQQGAVKIGNWFKNPPTKLNEMKIGLPSAVKDNKDNIESVVVEFLKINENREIEDTCEIEAKEAELNLLGFVTIPVEVFEQCAKIQYKVKYKNNTTEILKHNNKRDAVYKSNGAAVVQQCIRHKTSELFLDSSEGRYACLKTLDDMLGTTLSLPTDTLGNKNLIYYTIYFNKGYVELLNKSVLSILENSKCNFDLLLITDAPTKELLLAQPFAKKISPKFLVTDTPFDGVEASQRKTKVFDYENIFEYDKVLFLDCDVVCLKDVSSIFNQKLEHDVLYTARNTNLAYWHHRTFHHGFEFLGEPHVKEMTFAKQMPFNAGQFLFRTSARMKKHFSNVNWFMVNWAGEYFFEQAFMCYYFCKAYMTEDTLLNKHMSIVGTDNKIEYAISENTCLVHFIAPPLDAATKLAYIEAFLVNLSKPQSEGVLAKFKKLFKKN